MTANEFRKLALRAPGAIEAEHMNHPDFRLAGKIFASLGYPDAGWGMVKLTPEQQQTFIKQAPDVFVPCNGAWGRAGCTSVHLASVTSRVLRSALNAARQNIAAGPKKKKRA